MVDDAPVPRCRTVADNIISTVDETYSKRIFRWKERFDKYKNERGCDYLLRYARPCPRLVASSGQWRRRRYRRRYRRRIMLRGSYDAVVRSSVRLLHELNIGSRRFPGRVSDVSITHVPKICVAIAAISAHLHDRDRSSCPHIVVALIAAAAPVHVGYRDRDTASTSNPADELSNPNAFYGGNLC